MKILLRCTSILKLSTGENNYTYCWKDFVFCLDFFSKPYHSFDMHIEKEKNRCAKNTGFAVRGDMPDLSATISFFDAFPCNILSNFLYVKKKVTCILVSSLLACSASDLHLDSFSYALSSNDLQFFF